MKIFVKSTRIMKREIKFRGKVKHHNPMTNPENGWVEGYYFQDLTQGEMRSYIFQPPCSWEVIPETIGQFTGLLDKNGKEIYEGDIIGCHNPDIKHLIFYNEKQGRFMAALNGDIENDFVGVCGLDDSRWNASKEVIGNIHDNPELQKGGKE